MKRSRMLVLAVGLTSVPALASGATYANPAQHFSVTVPDGLIALTPAELARGNAATAAEGGTPTLYEAGFAPPAAAGRPGPRLPLVLVRFIPGRTTLTSFADSYRADIAAAMRGMPTTAPAGSPAPVVTVDEAAHAVSSEVHRPTADGQVVKRKTVFVGHEGVAEVEWTGPATEVDTAMRPLLTSFKFDRGFEYAAPDVFVVKMAAPASNARRTVAAAILIGGSLLFLGVAATFFLRARRRQA